VRIVNVHEDSVNFAVLGPVRAWRGEHELDLGAPQQRALLATLLLRRGRPATLAELVDAVWGEEPPASAVSVLRTYASRLRKILEPGRDTAEPPQLVVSVGDGYLLRVEEDALDLAVFEQRVAKARKLHAVGELSVAAELLHGALAAWQGTALAGLPGPLAESERSRLNEVRLAALETRLNIDVELGRHAEVIAELISLTREHPLREQLCRLLMLALHRSGRQAEALAEYRKARSTLVAELGIEPGAALRDLHDRILAADESLAGDVAPVASVAGRLSEVGSPSPVGDASSTGGVPSAPGVSRARDVSSTAGVSPVGDVSPSPGPAQRSGPSVDSAFPALAEPGPQDLAGPVSRGLAQQDPPVGASAAPTFRLIRLHSGSAEADLRPPAGWRSRPALWVGASVAVAALIGSVFFVAGIGDTRSSAGTSCAGAAGSGAITDPSVCVSSTAVTFRATFSDLDSFQHVFINTDGDSTTGYQLPSPSSAGLGADYMIENGNLFRSRSASWTWTGVAIRPTMTVSGSTRTWKLSLKGIGSPTGTQEVVFQAGPDYTSVITYSPK
jgi:DNA-binding SARP family transcriptional activator